MPSRIIRDRILSSASLSILSHPAERLFYRLLLLADDHGRYHGSPQYVRHAALPLVEVSIPEVGRWLGELRAAGIICLYDVDRRQYLHFQNWGLYQRLRAKTSKFPPHEPCVCGHVATDDGGCLPESETESESETEAYTGSRISSVSSPSSVRAAKNGTNAGSSPDRRAKKLAHEPSAEELHVGEDRRARELLVQDIVEVTGDQKPESVRFFASAVQKLGEDHVRRLLSSTKSAIAEGGVRSPAKYFTSLANGEIRRRAHG